MTPSRTHALFARKHKKARFKVRLTMADPFSSKEEVNDSLTEGLLNPDVEEQLVLDEELPGTLHVGEKQSPKFRDPVFGVIFVLQIITVTALAITWGFPALRYGPSQQSNDANVEFSGILYICLIAGLAGLAISALALSFMTRFAQFLVQFSVLFSVFSSLIMVIVLGLQDNDGAAFVAFIFFAISAWYAWMIWHRLDFAASNLVTALSAVRANLGIVLVAYAMVFAAIVWSFIWMTSLIGVYSRSADCDSQGVCHGSVGAGTMVLYLLSFYWTHQVFINLIHVAVAGVVGTWWFDPAEASSLCSSAIMDSIVRSMTFSFGSICFGSLITAAIQVARHLVEHARRQGNDGILFCVLDCLLGCIESIVQYFNRYAYVYIGLYGYSYLEASRKVLSLFSQRGWSVIINDDLVNNVLSLMSVMIGLLTGCVGLAVAGAHKAWVAEFPEQQSLTVPFFSTFLIGILIASILMSVVSSAVDTVIVCFAEAPADLQQNYPHLSNQMTRAWRKVYPQEFVYAVVDEGEAGGIYTAPNGVNQAQDVPLVPTSLQANTMPAVAAPIEKTDAGAPTQS